MARRARIVDPPHPLRYSFPTQLFQEYADEIEAGATCTDLIEEPAGVDAVAHGAPKKFGFIGEVELEVVVVTEDPDVVQICFVDETPRENDVSARVSFEPEENEAA